MKAFIALGSEAEVLGILPIIQREFEQSGEPPKLILEPGCLPLFHGFGDCVEGFGDGYSAAIAYAKRAYSEVVAFPSANDVCVQHRHPSYQFDQWDRADCLHLWNKLPLTLPRPENAAVIVAENFHGKPTILLADNDSERPFPFRQELRELLANNFPLHQVVRLEDCEFPTLLDSLALHDAAELIVCAETAHLPLSRATKTPVIVFANDQPGPWHGSAPQRRFAFYQHYGGFTRGMGALVAAAREAVTPGVVDKSKPSVVMVYVHVPGDVEHLSLTKRFVETYLKFPPEYPHRTIIVSQKEKPNDEMRQLLLKLPNASFYIHDDTGWDIGAFIAVSRIVSDDFMVCFGGTSYLQRAGWLKRMVDVWRQEGPGYYGTLGTYEISPHINTSGFFCLPELLAEYPYRIDTKADRYEFEHGSLALFKRCLANGIRTRIVTWDGSYEWPDWRKPPNVYRRGDQSNLLTCFRHTDNYQRAAPAVQKRMAELADTLTDPVFLKLRQARPTLARVVAHQTHPQ